ncbi:MAG: GTP cyclohydrolase II [Rhodospirillales bacterium]
MTKPPHLSAVPTTREPLSRLAVDRAVSELRRGRAVVILAGDGRAILALAAENATQARLDALGEQAGAPAAMAMTGRRATVLNMVPSPDKVAIVAARGDSPLDAALALDLADPLSGVKGAGLIQRLKRHRVERADRHSAEAAAIQLTKIARLLPAAIVAAVSLSDNDDVIAWSARHDLIAVDAGDVFQYEASTARSLKRISEASVPLADAAVSRVIAFRPADGGLEHLAIVIGEPDGDTPVLARLHSECFTGDLLGSLRCDCGDQLRGAIAEIAKQGAGVLLYLAQEGRGIGLVNKLRAYTLQDEGFDTVEANEQLGYDADERVYLPAAQMLRDLGFSRVRLMTNNPEKVAQLAACGVEVTDRVGHAFPSNQHNEQYLRTKAARSGHLI